MSTHPSPLWAPSPAAAAASGMGRFLARVQSTVPSVTHYESLHRWSVRHFRDFWRFWLDASGIVHEGDSEPVVRHAQMPFAEFFPELRLNFAENLLRRDDEGVAIVSLAEGRAPQRYTYRALRREVARVRAGLRGLGVQRGDRVAGIMPNIAETVVAMLATASLGATWSSCSPDFGVQGAVDRFGQIGPKVLFAPNAYGYNGKTFDCVAKAQQIAAAIPSVQQVVIVPVCGPAPQGTMLWEQLGHGSTEPLAFERVPFNQPLFILYSSGTTGVPKCIVHGVGGTLLQLTKELMLHSDIGPSDNLMYFTTCGWMMWNWMVAGLFTGCVLTLFDGSPTYPAATCLWETVQEQGVTHFGTSAKYLGSCRIAGMRPRKRFGLETLRMVLSTGSPLLPEDFDWFYDAVGGVPLCSISGGTDIVSCFMLGNPLLPVYRGEIQAFGLGMDVLALDDAHQAVHGIKGELACGTPFASMPVAFWDDPDGTKYRKAYFERVPGTWLHGDTICVTGTQGHCGGVVMYGRSDATLKPGGVRIGTAEIYRLVEILPEVEDSVVIGQPWEGDVRVVLFVKLQAGTPWSPELEARIKASIRNGATPRHVPAVLLPVDKIPYTKSGKKMELAVLEVVSGKEPKNLEAMQDPSALACFRNLERLRA